MLMNLEGRARYAVHELLARAAVLVKDARRSVLPLLGVADHRRAVMLTVVVRRVVRRMVRVAGGLVEPRRPCPGRDRGRLPQRYALARSTHRGEYTI